jgi:N6-L-threonylcarbamoyladenine synthase
MIILGIETSCDETAAAVICGSKDKVEVLSNIVSSQIEIHKKYGGVVPEMAAREHVLNILPVINEALEKAGITRNNAAKKIDAIAVTVGPGLITSLIVGVETAKTLAYVWNIPIVAVNHIEGHIYANFVGTKTNNQDTITKRNIFPSLILTVSGGHTMLVLMKGHGKFEIIGDTRDDAAGEAFDKAAKMMEIGYPGGPAIAAKAAELQKKIPQPPCLAGRQALSLQFGGQARGLTLPRPMINSGNFEFSFSGLKTALLYELKKDKNWKKRKPEYSSEFQQAVVDVLISKTIKAAKKFGVKNIMLAGGVAANLELRKQMDEKIKNLIPVSIFNIPDLQYTTDNAVMVATAGYYKALRKKFTPWQKLKADCNLKLGNK